MLSWVVLSYHSFMMRSSFVRLFHFIHKETKDQRACHLVQGSPASLEEDLSLYPNLHFKSSLFLYTTAANGH